VTDVLSSPHLNESEMAALIYTVGQDRDLERRAYSHLAICAECTRLIGTLRDADRDTGSLLSSLDVPPPSQSADSIIRAARLQKNGFAFGWRRAAAVVGFLIVAGTAAAAAIPSSPLHRLLLTVLGSSGRSNVEFGSTPRTPEPQPVSPAVSLAAKPGAALEVSFSDGSVGGTLDVHIIDQDQITLSSPSAGAIYRVSANRIAVEQSTPAKFQLSLPRSLHELRVRVGNDVVFERRPTVPGTADSFTIQLTRPNASR
jgi:hypothetical protein